MGFIDWKKKFYDFTALFIRLDGQTSGTKFVTGCEVRLPISFQWIAVYFEY